MSESLTWSTAAQALSNGLVLVPTSRLAEDLHNRFLDACSAGDVEQMELLVQVKRAKGEDNFCGGAERAAKKGHADAVKWLLANGAGTYPDFLACVAAKAGSESVLLELMQCGWNIETESFDVMFWAIHDIHMVKWLLDHGAPPRPGHISSAACINRIDVLVIFIAYGGEFSISTALHSAASSVPRDAENPFAMLEYLVSLGLDINAIDSDLLIHQPPKERRLPAGGGKVVNTLGTPMANAVMMNCIAGVKWLLERGGDPTIAGVWGTTAVSLARRSRFYYFLRLFREYGYVTEINPDGPEA